VLYGGGLLLVAELALVVYCVLNVVTTPAEQVRNLPKLLWLALVLLFPIVGGIAWLVAGRPQGPARSLPYKGNAGIPNEYDRPGRATATSPEEDEAFLRSLRERAEQQRRAAELERRARLEREEREQRREPEQPA
jgi:hypothetical protein